MTLRFIARTSKKMTPCQAVCNWAQANGIQVTEGRMEAGKAGEFDGLAVRLNESYDLFEKTYYLVHALGSIVRWSLSQDIQGMFDELRDAKTSDDPARLEMAIERYRRFEIESSEFAVWLLAQVGLADLVQSYTNFMRADLEALTMFHRTSHAPVWRDFFAQWNDEVATGERHPPSFSSQQIPPFVSRKIERQEILQKQAE
jgi:hypothetical protein